MRTHIAGQFKDRKYGHDFDFENLDQKNSTKHLLHNWSLKEENKPYQIKWEVVTRTKRFSAVSSKCDVCTSQQFEIVFNTQKSIIKFKKWIVFIMKT